MRWLPLLLVLAACTKGNTIDEDTDSDADTDADTDSDTDADTDADTDSDTDADTDTDTDVDADVVFDFEGDWAGATLTLTWFQPGAAWDPAAPSYGQGEVDADPYGVALDDPPPTELLEPDPTNYPGLEIAIYLPALHEDLDGDGLQNDGEPYLAVDPTWVLFAAGTIPADLAAVGLVAGWNAVVIDFETGDPTFGSALAIPFPVNLRPIEEITIGGTYVDSISDGDRIAVIPMAAFDGASVASFLYDDATTDPWEIAISGAPPADHLAPLDGWGGAEGALEVPLSYNDADGSGGPGEGDVALNPVCYGSDTVILTWLPSPVELDVAWSLASIGWAPGWSALAAPSGGGDPTVLPVDAYEALEISSACSLGG